MKGITGKIFGEADNINESSLNRAQVGLSRKEIRVYVASFLEVARAGAVFGP